MKTVGILALQGDFDAHGKALHEIGAQPLLVRSPAEFAQIDGLILPGGESTTMLNLLHRQGLYEPLRSFGQFRPIFGTCAGVILLSKIVHNPAQESLGLMDLTVQRNGYGRQIDSSVSQIHPTERFEERTAPGAMEAVFIRAPVIESVGPEVSVLAEYRGHARSGGAKRPHRCYFPPGALERLPRPSPISEQAVKNVLFVCLGNSCRSQMAEGFARHYGAGIINPASAGLAAIHSIARETRDAMLEVGVDLSDQFPKDFEPAIAAKYDVVVNMSGFLLPPYPGNPDPLPELLEWEVQDPYGDDISVHRKVRDDIEGRVKRLIDNLKHPVGQRIAPASVRKTGLWQRFTRWR